ncbi:hypothetical protein [Ruixingdingia sedimenti]|uniref:Argininosuccinate lyase n=1 Tax=Ruixingdingia sedimenti TaxID=3073604 RepID=A0ABU1F9A5_9RHOB|nr:hypothetical protein [Xinfangfangia sp. LG-4]MDR5653451.1 hypothetical protein [Xinfangfangia sp. LG-4]
MKLIRIAAFALPLGLLAACGAEGPPTHPQAQDGVTVSGEARMGVQIRK